MALFPNVLMLIILGIIVMEVKCKPGRILSTLLLEPLEEIGSETIENDKAIHAVAKAVSEILGKTEQLNGTVNTLKKDIGIFQQLNNSVFQLQKTAKIDDCASNPCIHGICRDFFAGYSCHCEQGYTGDNCQDVDDCPLNACGLKGECIDLDNDYDCICWNKGQGKNCDEFYHDCYEIKESGRGTESGVYTIAVNIDGSSQTTNVYCDMTTDGGGWTILLKRFSGEEDFAQNWRKYEDGFGNKSGEYWLGLKWVYGMTSNKNYTLRVDLTKPDGSKAYQKYETFNIDAGPGYVLRLSDNTEGSAGDGGQGLSYHNNQRFLTKDNSTSTCIRHRTDDGGWWFKNCYYVYLTATYSSDKFRWYSWTGSSTLKAAIMKIRPS